MSTHECKVWQRLGECPLEKQLAETKAKLEFTDGHAQQAVRNLFIATEQLAKLKDELSYAKAKL